MTDHPDRRPTPAVGFAAFEAKPNQDSLPTLPPPSSQPKPAPESTEKRDTDRAPADPIEALRADFKAYTEAQVRRDEANWGMVRSSLATMNGTIGGLVDAFKGEIGATAKLLQAAIDAGVEQLSEKFDRFVEGQRAFNAETDKLVSTLHAAADSALDAAADAKKVGRHSYNMTKAIAEHLGLSKLGEEDAEPAQLTAVEGGRSGRPRSG